jgi:hypothetical protein
VAPLIRKSWQSLRRQAAVARSVYFARGLRPWSLFVYDFPSEDSLEFPVVFQNLQMESAEEALSAFKCLDLYEQGLD